MATEDRSLEQPISVAVLTSISASRLRYLLEEDPNRGEKYEIVAGVTNHEDNETIPLFEEHDVPSKLIDIHSFYEVREADFDDMSVRADFDAEIMAFLEDYEPDLVVLSGYLHIVSRPMIERYYPRIVNIHHADLTQRSESGGPMYPGLTSVRDAVMNGEERTHETTHVLTPEVDAGPLLVRSPPFETHPELIRFAREQDAEDILKAYAFAHREWMIRAVGRRTLAKTIELFADGRVRMDDDGIDIDHDLTVYQLQ